ncbi:MAG: Bug family tripartite tricarboxylate transporter substrate binding protein [Burkholderiaceae bacterium]
MNLFKRCFLKSAVALSGAALLCGAASAQTWPAKPLTIVVPYAPGGPTDFIARILGEALAKELGQAVLISNRPGASGTIGTQSVKTAPADGYTLLHTTIAAQALNPVLYPDWKVNPLTDFTVIGTTATLPNVLVVSTTQGPATLDELIKRGKSRPEGLSYATFGAGTSPHILGVLLQKAAGFKAVAVPYKGSAPALVDVMAGQVDFSFDNITTSAPQVKAGRAKALAIASPQRSKTLPEVPTLAELGFAGFDLSFGFSLSAPAGTPKEVVQTLQDAFQKISRSAEYAHSLQDRGAEPLVLKKEEVPGFIQSATVRWGVVAKELGLQPERK